MHSRPPASTYGDQATCCLDWRWQLILDVHPPCPLVPRLHLSSIFPTSQSLITLHPWSKSTFLRKPCDICLNTICSEVPQGRITTYYWHYTPISLTMSRSPFARLIIIPTVSVFGRQSRNGIWLVPCFICLHLGGCQAIFHWSWRMAPCLFLRCRLHFVNIWHPS